MFCEGACWGEVENEAFDDTVDSTQLAGILRDSRPKELLPHMPIIYIKAVQVQPTWEPSAVGYLRPEPTIYNCPVYLTTRAAASDAPFRRRNKTLRLLGSAARPSCSWRRSRRTCPRRSGCSAASRSSPSSINELQRAPTALPAPTARALAALGVTRVPAITDPHAFAPARHAAICCFVFRFGLLQGTMVQTLPSGKVSVAPKPS